MDKNKYIFPIIVIGAVIAIILVVVFVVGSGDEDSQTESSESTEQATDTQSEESSEDEQQGQEEPVLQSSRTLDNGLVINTYGEGEGEGAQDGNRITADYEGRLNDEEGNIFDSSYEKGIPISFILGASGADSVIAGWNQGLLDAKVGQTIMLTIPPELGYGESGAGELIPPNSTLFFKIEVLDIASE